MSPSRWRSEPTRLNRPGTLQETLDTTLKRSSANSDISVRQESSGRLQLELQLSEHLEPMQTLKCSENSAIALTVFTELSLAFARLVTNMG
jgi:hypothetical protein